MITAVGAVPICSREAGLKQLTATTTACFLLLAHHYLLTFDNMRHLLPVERVSLSFAPDFIHACVDLNGRQKTHTLDALPELVSADEGLARLLKDRKEPRSAP